MLVAQLKIVDCKLEVTGPTNQLGKKAVKDNEFDFFHAALSRNVANGFDAILVFWGWYQSSTVTKAGYALREAQALVYQEVWPWQHTAERTPL